MAGKAALIFNPSSGGGKSLRKKPKVESLLRSAGIKYDLYMSRDEDHLKEISQYATQNHPLILGVGGDTTLNIIAREIINGKRNNTLGIIPLGSVNDFAREFNSLKTVEAINRIRIGKVSEIDVGTVTAENGSVTRHFLVSVSMGLGVFVNRYVDQWMKKHPQMSKARSISQTVVAIQSILRAYKEKIVPFTISLSAGDQSYHIVSPLIVFLNTSRFAGGHRLCPDATPFDGNLDCCIFTQANSSFLKLTRTSLDLRKGEYHPAQIEFLKHPRFTISSPTEIEFQVDGEIFSLKGLISISVQSKALKVIT